MKPIDPKRQEELKSIIRSLHAGDSFASAKKRFAKLIRRVDAEEIAAMEQSLIQEGMASDEVQRLCDVHAQVFEAGLKGKAHTMPGHPIHTYTMENKVVRSIMKNIVSLAKKAAKKGEASLELTAEWQRLRDIEKHYARKENQLFPLLEAKGFTGPSKVMWGKHNEIREVIKAADRALTAKEWKQFLAAGRELEKKIGMMIFMEERILFPTSMKKLTEADWVRVREGEAEIGYAWGTPGAVWDPSLAKARPAPAQAESPAASQSAGTIPLSEGLLTPEQIDLMLTTLPLDVSFVDEHDRVRYYSANSERIFPRSPAVIGREVQNCHPHKSVHIVNSILDSFRKKEKKSAEFWIDLHGRFIHIRYFAMYGTDGAYRGCLEVSQDVTAIRALAGEKRLLSE